MAAGSESVWAVDLGNASLKAIHLMAVGDAVQVIGFDHIPHGKILSGGGISAAERDELVAITLRQFVQRNDVGDETLIISVPSQNSFAKFVTLPQVEQKRLPAIIQFEAAQQIPVDINSVQWDHQMLTEPDSKEQKVGIFAVKNEIVKAAMEHFEREDLQVGYVQISTMALYNFLLQDRPELVRSDSQATVIVNVGADCTDIVVCTKSGVWQRCIMKGGNAFTQAIAETFKLGFEKAEKLKRTAPVSKYARQIFQAMRPVFADWASEVQRSLGFYTSSNTDVKLARVIAMGGGTKLRGLTKYLGQSLEIPVEKPESFKKLSLAEGLSAAKFHDNVADFGVAYGLALQGVGMARIESNLLPGSVARSMAWANKTRLFIAAAILVLISGLAGVGKEGLSYIAYAQGGDARSVNKSVINRARDLQTRHKAMEDSKTAAEEKEKAQVEFFKHRDVLPGVYEAILAAMPNATNNPSQAALYEAFARGDVAAIKKFPRSERKQLLLTRVLINYSMDLSTAQFNESASARKDALQQQASLLEGASGEGAHWDDETSSRTVHENVASSASKGANATVDRGFVVTVVGYSPYGSRIMDLIDPPGVEKDRSRWGLITRLDHPDKIGDVNSPFKLYSRKSSDLKIETGVVDLGKDVPWGVGIEMRAPAGPAASRSASGQPAADRLILVDALTRDEQISADAKLDPTGKGVLDLRGKPVYDTVRDYWFAVSFKIKWKDAPDPPAAAASSTR
jgi:type IV pilus assembly protein PilM